VAAPLPLGTRRLPAHPAAVRLDPQPRRPSDRSPRPRPGPGARKAPDIETLKRRLRLDQAVANSIADPYDDRQGNYRARRQDAEYRVRGLLAEIAEMETKRKADLAAIHSEAKRAGIDEETRRAMIERISQGRTRTSGELSAPERTALLRELGSDKVKRRPSRAGRGPSQSAMDRQTMLTRVEQLLTEQRLPWEYAEAILRRQRGIADKSVACPIQSVTDPELRGVIAALYRRANPTAPRSGA